MRSSKSRSRNKNRNNNNRSVGNVINRVFDSSGPEGKVRGTPQQIIDKYNQLAQDAQLSNDRVAAENFQQHAEHYQRLLAEAQREQDARREQVEREQRERQQQRDEQRNDNRDKAAQQDVSGSGDQPDVIEISKDEGGLVETPEVSEPAAPRARRPRKPKAPKPVAADEPSNANDNSPEAAE
jgi:hypothetical protein